MNPSPRLLLRGLAIAALVVGCASAGRPTAPATPRASTPPPAPADALVDANLGAVVSQGNALPEHIGPDAARAVFDDFARRPTVYLDRFEARYVTAAPNPSYPSLLLAPALWRLRRHDGARVRRIALQVIDHYRALSRRPPRADDPGYPERIARRTAELAALVEGVDVAPGPGWPVVPGSELATCLTTAVDGAQLLRVTRACTCGQTLSCVARAASGSLQVEVRVDPDSQGVCTECYARSTNCIVPELAPTSNLRVIVNGTPSPTVRACGPAT